MIGEWRIYPSLDEICRRGTRIKLEPRKMQLLLALARRPGELLTTEELLDTVWSGVIVTQSSLYQSIAQLRKTLDADADPGGTSCIATVPRKGYRLVAPVSETSEPATPLAVPPPAPEPPERPERRWFIRTAAAATTVLAGAGVWWWARPRTARSVITLAVLPFDDVSPGGTEQPLADGLANEVIAALTGSAEVKVTGRASSFQFRQSSLPLAEVGQRLDVTHALTGEVSRNSNRVRLTVRLRRVSDGDVLWRAALEEPADAISPLPRRVASGALAALHAPDLARQAPAPSGQAYELYLLGVHFLEKRTPEDVLKAREYFQRAVETDAAFALGYVALAHSWLSEFNYGSGLTIRDMDVRAQPLLDRALRLQPDLPEALATQGYLKAVLGRFGEARGFLQRALAAQPHSATSHLWLGMTEGWDGFPGPALASYRRALELDPLRFITHVMAGVESIHAGRDTEARQHYARAIELAPAHPNPRWGAGILGFARGRLGEAVHGYRSALEAESRREDLWTQLGWIYLDLQMPDEARRAFDQALALTGSTAQPRAARARAFLVEGDLPGLQRCLKENAFPPPGIRDVEIDTALLFSVLDDAKGARSAVDAAVGPMLADPIHLYGPWGVFLGHHALIDIAAVQVWLGRPEEAKGFLDDAEAFVDRYDRNGNVWHALGYHQARIAALRGNAERAFERLERAIQMGWRRGWWLRFDPAFRSIRESPRFAELVSRVQADAVTQRERLRGRAASGSP